MPGGPCNHGRVEEGQISGAPRFPSPQTHFLPLINLSRETVDSSYRRKLVLEGNTYDVYTLSKSAFSGLWSQGRFG